MLDPSIIDDIAKQLSDALPDNFKDMQSDIKQQFRHILEKVITDFDLVSREEFDTQCKVLARTREKLEALEKQLAEYEKRHTG